MKVKTLNITHRHMLSHNQMELTSMVFGGGLSNASIWRERGRMEGMM